MLPEENAAFQATARQFRGMCGKCGARRVDQQIGAEEIPDCGAWMRGVLTGEEIVPCGACYVCRLLAVFRGVHRVLRDDGVVWLNLGDSYQNGGQLAGIPWRVALAMQADGWILRSDVPWVKRSAMPESTQNRPCKSLEYVFMFTKRREYYFDMEAVRSSAVRGEGPSAFGTRQADAIGKKPSGNQLQERYDTPRLNGRSFRNSDLWFASIKEPRGLVGSGDELVGLDVTTEGLGGGHYAKYPTALIRPLIKASTSEKGACAKCGAPWRRLADKSWRPRCGDGGGNYFGRAEPPEIDGCGQHSGDRNYQIMESRTVGWEPTCECSGGDVVPCLVLDPFIGSGTTAVVCRQLGLRCWGVDLSEEYLREHAAWRCRTPPQLVRRTVADDRGKLVRNALRKQRREKNKDQGA